MSRITRAIALIVAFLLQTTIISNIKIFDVHPNLLLAVLLVVVFYSSLTEGVVYAALSGVLLDFMYGGIFGINTLLFIYISIGLKLIIDLFYNDGVKVMCLQGFLFTCIYEFLFGVASLLIWSEGVTAKIILLKVFLSGIYNALLIIPVFLIMRRLSLKSRYYDWRMRY